MIFRVLKNGQNRFGRSDKSIFGRFGRFFESTHKLLILKGFKADKKTDTTAKNISKNGRQNPYRGFGVSVNVGCDFSKGDDEQVEGFFVSYGEKIVWLKEFQTKGVIQ